MVMPKCFTGCLVAFALHATSCLLIFQLPLCEAQGKIGEYCGRCNPGLFCDFSLTGNMQVGVCAKICDDTFVGQKCRRSFLAPPGYRCETFPNSDEGWCVALEGQVDKPCFSDITTYATKSPGILTLRCAAGLQCFDGTSTNANPGTCKTPCGNGLNGFCTDKLKSCKASGSTTNYQCVTLAAAGAGCTTATDCVEGLKCQKTAGSENFVCGTFSALETQPCNENYDCSEVSNFCNDKFCCKGNYRLNPNIPKPTCSAFCSGMESGFCVNDKLSCKAVLGDVKNYQCGTFNKLWGEQCTDYECNNEKNLQCRKSDKEGYKCLCRTNDLTLFWDKKIEKCIPPCQGSTDGYCDPVDSCRQSSGEYKCFPNATTQCKKVPPELKVQVCGSFKDAGIVCSIDVVNDCDLGLSCIPTGTDSKSGLCCPSGNKVDNGKCQAPSDQSQSNRKIPNGGTCEVNTDCVDGLSCNQPVSSDTIKKCGPYNVAILEATIHANDFDGFTGASCASNVDCADGLSCIPTGANTGLCCPSENKVHNGICQALKVENRICNDTAECRSDLKCKLGKNMKVCTSMQGRGEECTESTKCMSTLLCRTPLGLTGSICGLFNKKAGASVSSSTDCNETLYFYKAVASDTKGTCLNYLSDGEDCTDKVTSMCQGTLKCQEITEGGGKKFVCGTFALKGTSCVVADKRACDSSLECSLRVQILNKDPEYFCCPKDQKYDNGACVPSCGSIVEDKQVSGYCESMGSKCKLIGDTYTCGSFDKEAGSQCTSDNDCNINNGLFCDNKKCKLPTLGQKCYLESSNTAQDGFACANSVSCRKLTENSVSKIGICCPLADNIKIVIDKCLCSETSEHPVENSGIFTCPPKITCSATNPQGTCGGSEVCQRISDKEYGCGIFSKSIAKPCEKLSDCCYGPDCGEIKVSCTMETFAPDKANPETAMGDPLTGKTGGCCPAKNPVFLSSGKCGCAKGLIYDADGDGSCKPQCGGTTHGLCGIYLPTTGKWDKAPGVTCKKIWNGNYECGFHNGAVGYSCNIDHDCQNDRSDLQCRYGNCCQRAQTYTDRPDEDWIWCQPYHECLDANRDPRITNINGRCFRIDDNW